MSTQNPATRFIAFRDFVDPAEKAKPEWVLTCLKDFYQFGGALSMLDGKDVAEIFLYAAGNHDTKFCQDMFKGAEGGRNEQKEGLKQQGYNSIREKVVSLKGIDFEPLGILQQPLGAAVATLQKGLTYISCRAIDGLATTKREKDLERLRNRPAFEARLQPVKEKLGVAIDPPGTDHNSKTVDIASLGLDPSKPDELNLYTDLFYKLRPESAIEVALYALSYVTEFKKKIDLERRDHVYFGCSANRSYHSQITGLPSFDYLFPGNVYLPPSDLPDAADVPFKYVLETFDAEKMMNTFGDQGITEDIVIGVFEQHWASQGKPVKWSEASEGDKRAGVPVAYFEWKSFDVIRVLSRTTASGRKDNSLVPFSYRLNREEKPGDVIEQKFPQQTHFAYWVPMTDRVLKHGRLEGSFRAPGRESLSPWSINTYRSKVKSDVELCRTIVKDAQRAYTKLQHSLISAKPKGSYIDLKFLRRAAEGLAAVDPSITVTSLLTLWAQDNIMIGDTEDMDGVQDGNFKPFQEVPGGLSSEIGEYLLVIKDCNDRIAKLTGINDALTGQTPGNADQLVGIQKLLLQSSLNSLHYAQKAIKSQTDKVFTCWVPLIQWICDTKNKQTASRKALENIIGSEKLEIITELDNLPLHHFGIEIDDAPNEEQQQELKMELFDLVKNDRLDYSDYYAIKRIFNYKDAQALLAIKEKKKAAEKQQAMMEQLQVANQRQAMIEQSKLNVAQITSQGEVQEEQVKAALQQFLAQFNRDTQVMLRKLINEADIAKKGMQGDQAVQKLLAKKNLDAQTPA